MPREQGFPHPQPFSQREKGVFPSSGGEGRVRVLCARVGMLRSGNIQRQMVSMNEI